VLLQAADVVLQQAWAPQLLCICTPLLLLAVLQGVVVGTNTHAISCLCAAMAVYNHMLDALQHNSRMQQ
jgi:hypothetical protein